MKTLGKNEKLTVNVIKPDKTKKERFYKLQMKLVKQSGDVGRYKTIQTVFVSKEQIESGFVWQSPYDLRFVFGRTGEQVFARGVRPDGEFFTAYAGGVG